MLDERRYVNVDNWTPHLTWKWISPGDESPTLLAKVDRPGHVPAGVPALVMWSGGCHHHFPGPLNQTYVLDILGA